ncbi:Two component signal transduction histidine kinase, subgroup 3, dimerisation and phosphoacceptor region [Blastococcus saxobsidens DD2]|uniref:histidine kinase n=1 Tax=Blastococcus saxobsidens (strain DD2) TaxID=1146883 RepID=H6RV82_BLASD|nr:Two component signal transduction histidine kinase, subgroup 3, dimerisation and phosphoacceptor region [Blastococcus saxobsidens DD2]
MVRGLAGRPAIVDALVAGALVALGLVEAATTPLDRPAWLHALLTVVVMGAVAWRRRFPLAVLAFVVAGVMVIDADGQFAVFAALVIVSFTAGTELDPPRAWVGLALAVVPFCIAFAVTGGEVSDFVAVTVLYGGSWVVGQAVRDRTRRSLEAAERADRAERTRKEDAARAVAAERARIARELHDGVAHSLSVIAVQTQAVRRRLDPALGREIDELRAVEVTARQAMAEMRRLFGVLRADGERPALAPQPGLDQLDRLVTDTRAGTRNWTWKSWTPAVPGPASRTAAVWGWSGCGSGWRSTAGCWRWGSSPAVASPSGPACRSGKVPRHDRAGGGRRRPADGAGRVAFAARKGGRRRRRGRRPGRRGCAHLHPPPGAGRGAHGHPHAGAGRAGGHPPAGGRRSPDTGAGADHLRPGRVRVRRPARRRERLPAQGRHRRGTALRGPDDRRRRGGPRAVGHPPRDRGVRDGPQGRSPAGRPAGRAESARGRGAAAPRPRPGERGDRPRPRRQRRHGEDAREQRPHQARAARPRPGGDLRLRERPAPHRRGSRPRLTGRVPLAAGSMCATCPTLVR